MVWKQWRLWGVISGIALTLAGCDVSAAQTPQQVSVAQYAMRQPTPPIEPLPAVPPPVAPVEASAPPPPAQEQPEVMTRGPVHEAFAEPVNVEVEAGIVAPAAPPPAVRELPPAERPQGANYVWVPGYWAWDSERNDYIWVSACWRVAPPNMYWVPGYWSRTTDGWVWVSGFWAPVGNKDLAYLPPPPELIDIDPPAPAPSPDYIWVPPCWYWYERQYVLRSGYWTPALADWVWVPSHYTWTPRGYVFVAGYWDYSLTRRGVLFAPIYFSRRSYVSVGFIYTPSVVVDLGALEFSLFAYPRYCHYYFGDYYDDIYFRVGIYPWCDAPRLHIWYDPIYEHERSRRRHKEPRWEEHHRREYDRRREDRDLRPPRDYREMERRAARMPETDRRRFEVVKPLTAQALASPIPAKLEPVTTDERREYTEEAEEVRKLGDERHRWESRRSGGPTVVTPAAPASPITVEESPGRGGPGSAREFAPSRPTPTVRKLPTDENRLHGEPAETPGVRSEPATSQPAPVPVPEERRPRSEPVVTPSVKSEPATPEAAPIPVPEETPKRSKGRRPGFIPPPAVNPPQPDRVEVPVPKIECRKSGSEKERTPPALPAEERRQGRNERSGGGGREKVSERSSGPGRQRGGGKSET